MSHFHFHSEENKEIPIFTLSEMSQFYFHIQQNEQFSHSIKWTIFTSWKMSNLHFHVEFHFHFHLKKKSVQLAHEQIKY